MEEWFVRRRESRCLCWVLLGSTGHYFDAIRSATATLPLKYASHHSYGLSLDLTCISLTWLVEASNRFGQSHLAVVEIRQTQCIIYISTLLHSPHSPPVLLSTVFYIPTVCNPAAGYSKLISQ